VLHWSSIFYLLHSILKRPPVAKRYVLVDLDQLPTTSFYYLSIIKYRLSGYIDQVAIEWQFCIDIGIADSPFATYLIYIESLFFHRSIYTRVQSDSTSRELVYVIYVGLY